MSARRTARVIGTGLACLALVLGPAALPAFAGPSTCGVSSSHTVCVTLPDAPLDANGVPLLSARPAITVTDSPNNGSVFYTWIRDAGSSTQLMLQEHPFGATGDYSFVWPTDRFLDGTGTLRLQVGSTSAAAIDVRVDLFNGNVSSVPPGPTDWTLPTPWTGTGQPLIAAVGDGPDGATVPSLVEASMERRSPALFLFLGDIYETGTYTENVNHYGSSALDDPVSATIWGRMAQITQPTVGNHEYANLPAWTDYWHGRPDYVSFDFGGIRFFDLDANKKFGTKSAQYAFVKNLLAPIDPSAPSCIVAYWHQPVFSGGNTATGKLPMWKLLASDGGDLVLNGHVHSMAEYRPLDANGQTGGSAHMVELIDGAGGHSVGQATTDARLEWALGKTPGGLFLTPTTDPVTGAVSGLSWTFEDVDGTVLHGGSVSC